MFKYIALALRLCFYGTGLFRFFAISINIVQLCSLLFISPFSRRRVMNINSQGAFSMWWVMQDEEHLRRMFKVIKAYAAPIWVVNFVEGTRLNPRKLRDGQRFSRDKGLPVLQNLLVPRTKGFVACVRQLRDTHVQYIYDFTIAYRHISRGFQFPPNLLQVHACSPLTPSWAFHVHVKRYAIKDLPRDDEELGEWVRQIFVEKDLLLEDMKHRWTQSDKLGQVREEKYFN
ncbi:2080_t:CDS:2 [Acaulospora morrowiae]|uniref:2080_t:CDS:1 n=1 Tax=Acaulospora morrowiae TaxID=94023 RepID=A0A9N8V7V0_9GLOM|nr:2080_t:CDS:2 [Acaulospora morrowiae]